LFIILYRIILFTRSQRRVFYSIKERVSLPRRSPL